MSKTYRVKLTTDMWFDLKADDKDQANWWINMHSMEDVMAQTKRYEIDYTGGIMYEYSDDYDDEDIDISTEEE